MALSHDDNLADLMPNFFNREEDMDVEESVDTRVLEEYREALDSDATIRSRDVCSLNQHELGLLNRKSLRIGTGTSQGQKRPARKFDLTLKPLPYEEVASRMMGSHVVSEKQISKMKRHGTGRVKKRRPFGLRTPNFADDEEFEEEDEEIHAVFAKKDQPSKLGEDQMRLEDMLQKKADVRAGSMVWNSLVLNPSGHTGNTRERAEATEPDSEAPESVTHLNDSGIKNLHTAFEENGIGRVEVSESPVADATEEVERDEAAHQADAEEKDHGAEGDEPMTGSPQSTEVDSGASEAMEGMMDDGVSGAEQVAEKNNEDDVEIMCSAQISKKPCVSPLPAVVEAGSTSSVSDTVPNTPVAQQAPTVALKSALKSGRKSAGKSVRIAGSSGSPEEYAVLPLTPEAGSYLTRKKSSKAQKEKSRNLRNRRSSLAGGGLVWDGNIRKSTRPRMKPLEWWRLEMVTYGRPHQSLPTPVEVQVCSPEPYWPAVPPGGLKRRVGLRKMALPSLCDSSDASIVAIE